MLLASLKCQNLFILTVDNVPKTANLKDDIWKDGLCAARIPCDKDIPYGDMCYVVNFANANYNQVCDKATGKLVTKKHQKNQGEDCSGDEDCLHNYCIDNKCSDVEEGGECSTHTWLGTKYNSRCPNGQYCNVTRCAPVTEIGKTCNKDDECGAEALCSDTDKTRQKRVCVKNLSVNNGVEIFTNNQNICKSLTLRSVYIAENDLRTFCVDIPQIHSTQDKCIEKFKVIVNNSEVDKTLPYNKSTIVTKYPLEQLCADNKKVAASKKKSYELNTKAYTLKEWTEAKIDEFRNGGSPVYDDCSDDVMRYLVDSTYLLVGAVLIISLIL